MKNPNASSLIHILGLQLQSFIKVTFTQQFLVKVRKGCQVFSSLNVQDSMLTLHTWNPFQFQVTMCGLQLGSFPWVHHFQFLLCACNALEVCKNVLSCIVSCMNILPGSSRLNYAPWWTEFSVGSIPLLLGSFSSQMYRFHFLTSPGTTHKLQGRW